ncbi:LemA family protein [Candidatus Peregrinibacteria bacterium]|nr:LemA family protein [Candidatus Peregrinibacteria bacterium]
MKPLSVGKIIGLVVLGLLIIFALWLMATYNSFVSFNENAKTAQADIEVQYQRRFDVIPNLVKTAEGIANLEKSVFTSLAEARSKYAGAQPGSDDRIKAMGQFDTSLSRLMVIVENYPVLKSSESFLKLQDSIEGTENRISVARQNYNAVVNQLNKKIQYFPSNFVARIFGFGERTRFEVLEPAAKTAPKVEFDFK